jgi:hypothetical protein
MPLDRREWLLDIVRGHWVPLGRSKSLDVQQPESARNFFQKKSLEGGSASPEDDGKQIAEGGKYQAAKPARLATH